jgi:hypothetical protein
MRHCKLYTSIALLVVFAGLIAVGLRGPSAPVIAANLWSYQPVVVREQLFWEMIFDVTNLTSSSLRFPRERERVDVRVSERWQELGSKGLISYLKPNGSERLCLYVPEQAQVCRFAMGYVQDPLDEMVDSFLSKHKLPAWLERLCRGAGRECPPHYRRLTMELKLPTTYYALNSQVFPSGR